MSGGLFGAIKSYADSEISRFHMPGHKGKLSWLGEAARYDLTEITGLDYLYDAAGCIKKTEDDLAALYGSAACAISAGGATLCIQAMLAAALKPGEKLLCFRNCHISAINAMALLGLEPVWLFPGDDIAAAMAENPDAKALYVTSPDYYGNIRDIAGISGLCRGNIPLLVDNAHGAHLKFMEPDLHPISLGADMVCDSLHKTLPALTGAAALHLKDGKLCGGVKRKMSVFGSTSPSYLIMASIDRLIPPLLGDLPARLRETAGELAALRELAVAKGFVALAAEPSLKLTLGFYAMGYTRGEFLAELRANKIEPEMCDSAYCVLMAGPHNAAHDFTRLEGFIRALPKKPPLPPPTDLFAIPEAILPVREAAFAEAEEIPVEESTGRIAASYAAACPPGLAIAVPGELVDENLALVLKRYGISRLSVVK